MRAVVVTGVLGGFTTFSAFSLETVRMIADGRPGLAFGYVATSVLVCLAAAFVGVLAARIVAA